MSLPKFGVLDVSSILTMVKSCPSSDLESETVEFKGYRNEAALHNSKDIPEELSALANKGGGLVVVGVLSENEVPHGDWPSQLAGIAAADILNVRDRLAGRLRPNVTLWVRNIEFEGRVFLAIEIAGVMDSLVSTSGGKYYIRDGRSSRPMSPDEITKAVKALASFDWSADLVDCKFEEVLDMESVGEAIGDFQRLRVARTPISIGNYLEAVGATNNGQLLRGGLAFLGTAAAIKRHLGDFEYRFSWKKPGGELAINDVWDGNLWRAVVRAKAHFSKCNNKIELEFREKKFQTPLLDDSAFNEAFMNALVHRDYSSEGMVSATFTGQDMVIASPGTFYGGVTADNIAVHEPRHRNKVLARIFMNHHLVDRAGMGVTRMSLGALRYGRRFPVFQETPDSVRVTMQGEYIRAAVFVLAQDNIQDYGVGELLLLNMICDKGVVTVADLEAKFSRISADSWQSIQDAVAKISQVEFCGTGAGISVMVKPAWADYFGLEKIFRPGSNSHRHVKLYKYLRKHGNASNSDLKKLFGHSYSSQTSRFLRDAKYVQRSGNGPSARWALKASMS